MRLLILAVLVYMAYRVLRRWLGVTVQTPGRMPGNRPAEIDDEMVKDPYCGTYFARGDAVRWVHDGREYLFCSQACKDKFIEEHMP